MNRTVKYQGAFSRIVRFAGKRFLFSPPPSTFFFAPVLTRYGNACYAGYRVCIVQYRLLTFQPRIMHFGYQLIYLSLTLYGKQQNFSRTKRRQKVAFSRAVYRRNNRKKKNRKYHTGSEKKATNFGLKLFNGTPKFPYKFKEIINDHLPHVELIM